VWECTSKRGNSTSSIPCSSHDCARPAFPARLKIGFHCPKASGRRYPGLPVRRSHLRRPRMVPVGRFREAWKKSCPARLLIRLRTTPIRSFLHHGREFDSRRSERRSPIIYLSLCGDNMAAVKNLQTHFSFATFRQFPAKQAADGSLASSLESSHFKCN